MKVGFVSLGCPKNLVDSERMLWVARAGDERRIADLNGIGALRGAHNAQNAACATRFFSATSATT